MRSKESVEYSYQAEKFRSFSGFNKRCILERGTRREKDEGCKHIVTSTRDGTSQARGHITLFCAQIESLMTITGSSAIMMSDMALLSWTINS